MSRRTLILFDIDGTLTATCASDARCFAAAFDRTFGFFPPSLDWHDYEHVTDSGIVHESLAKTRGHGTTTEEMARFSAVYMEEIAADCITHPDDYREIPGARAIIDHLVSEQRDITISLATGCMRQSALFKLSKAGIDGAALPGGFADDAIARADIAKCAIARANVETDDIVYIGDGLWDVHTSAELGFRFVGITHQSSAKAFMEHNVSAMLNDYLDQDAFMEAVAMATAPLGRSAKQLS